MTLSLVLLFLSGVIVGVALYYWLADGYAHSEEGRRRAALRAAESRIVDAQVAALNRMADVAAEAVYEQTSGAPTDWPSDDIVVVEGELVPLRED